MVIERDWESSLFGFAAVRVVALIEEFSLYYAPTVGTVARASGSPQLLNFVLDPLIIATTQRTIFEDRNHSRRGECTDRLIRFASFDVRARWWSITTRLTQGVMNDVTRGA
jgi:hypothetical protein